MIKHESLLFSGLVYRLLIEAEIELGVAQSYSLLRMYLFHVQAFYISKNIASWCV